MGDDGSIHAAWVGFPHLHYFKRNGTLMLTNKNLGQWRMATFDVMMIDRYWMDNPPAPPGRNMNVRSFLRTYMSEMAKANYYYYNNTKEFFMGHKVIKGVLETPTLRVDGKIAGVIGSYAELTWPHIHLYKYPTIKEQLTCYWMGCGNKSRMAWVFQDQAKFLQQVKYGVDENARGLEDGTVLSIQEYANRIDTQILSDLDTNGVDGVYELVPGEEVEYG